MLLAVGMAAAGGAGAAEKYRFLVGPHPDGAANPALCTDQAQPWYASPQEACQGVPIFHPHCDRYTATYSGHVATLVGPASCRVTWQYRNVGSTSSGSWSGTWGMSLCSQNGLCSSGNTPEPEADAPPQAGTCEGNPILPATGEKLQHEHDHVDAGADPMHFVRTFRSSRALPSAPAQRAGLGRAWSHNHAAFVRQTPPAVDCALRYFVAQNSGGSKAATRLQACRLHASGLHPEWIAQIHDGTEPNAGAYVPIGDYCKIHKYQGGVYGGTIIGVRTIDAGACGPVGYAGITAEVVFGDGTARTFQKAASGAWASTDAADTLVLTASGLLYRRSDDDSAWLFDDSGRLRSVTQRNGWVRSYTYSTAATPPESAPSPGLLIAVTNQFGRSLGLAYNAAGQLSSVAAPDGQVIRYQYESASPDARLAVVVGGAAGAESRKYFYENATFPQLLTGIDELGVRQASFAYDAQGRAVSSQHAQGAGLHSITYGNGSATVRDPLGTQRTFSYGTARGKLVVTGATQPTGREGDAASRVQDVAGFLTEETDYLGVRTLYTWDAGRRLPLSVTQAAGRPEARTRSTQWHASLHLPVRIDEPGRSTSFTYDAGGNKLGELVTDTMTGVARAWSWTYDAHGLLAAARDPAGNTWQYGHDAMGNLVAETNPLGHLTRYTHDAGGRVLSRTEPSGLLTTFAYDPRGRLLEVDRGGERTTYAYAATGVLESVRFPNGHRVSYAYDDARRVVGWSDNRGARGTYVLDAMGNRVAEQLRDGTGSLVWQVARTINAFNRPASETLGASQFTGFGYDANGEPTSQVDGLAQRTSHGLDGLRRVIAITDAAGARASLAYDALDGVTAAADFKGVATGYSRNAFGEAGGETSADIGWRATDHDALGRSAKLTDALGQATAILRDALGRPTRISFHDDAVTFLRYDLSGPEYNAPDAPHASRGHLSEVQDRSGTTRWQRDALGRVTRKVQSMPDVGTFITRYAYNDQGLLDTLTYPAGAQLQHLYSPAGELVGLNWNGSPLVSGITWNPMGQPTGWNWVFGAALAASRRYDTAGRVSATEISSYGYDAAGRITRLAQQLAHAGGGPISASTTFATVTFTVGYDEVGRITSFGDTGGSTTFTYDANGNRLNSARTEGGQVHKRDYRVDPGSNRLLGLTHTASGPSGSASAVTTYGYNANGDLTSDGSRQYAYDAEGRLSSVAVGSTANASVTRYAHNALGQRVFKTEPVYAGVSPPKAGEEDKGFLAVLALFFSRMFSPQTQQAELLGTAFVYGEDGALLAEMGTGGAQSTGVTNHVWLPTPSGPMPVAAIVNGSIYAVHADHLNTPRRLTNAAGQPVWLWKYSAFGDEEPTRAAYRFAHPSEGFISNMPDVIYGLRYPGQYADRESGLHDNHLRTYHAWDGRYTQPDLIGLRGGWNRYPYVGGNPLSFSDSLGLAKDSVSASVESAIARGDTSTLRSLVESGGLNPVQQQAASSGLQRLERTAADIIANELKGALIACSLANCGTRLWPK